MQSNSNILDFCKAIIFQQNPQQAVEQNKQLIENITPEDVINVVHDLMNEGIEMKTLKSGVNKFMNIFYKSLSNYPTTPLENESLLYYLSENNRILTQKLDSIRPYIKQINQKSDDKEVKNILKQKFNEILPFVDYYTFKENVLFPAVEKHIKKHRCVQLMWSFHDDIRRNLKLILEILEHNNFNSAEFNKISGAIFFNMFAIKFRDDKILFPFVQKKLPQNILHQLLLEAADYTFPYVQPKQPEKISDSENINISNLIDLKTGQLSIEQIIAIFSNLPVDLTFVDENNKVRFYSSPKQRIFTRSISVIGRDVKNCHPPESVHIVERIIEQFRCGKREEASFWINMKEKYLLIRYFAVRNNEGIYKGVLEVTQEIQDIVTLTGQKRLLDDDF